MSLYKNNDHNTSIGSTSSFLDDINKIYRPYVHQNINNVSLRQNTTTGSLRQNTTTGLSRQNGINSASIRDDKNQIYRPYVHWNSQIDDIPINSLPGPSRQNSSFAQNLNETNKRHMHWNGYRDGRLSTTITDDINNLYHSYVHHNEPTKMDVLGDDDIENIYYINTQLPHRNEQIPQPVKDTATIQDDINKLYKSYVHRNNHADEQDDMEDAYQTFMYPMDLDQLDIVTDSVSDDIEHIYGGLALQIDHAKRLSLLKKLEKKTQPNEKRNQYKEDQVDSEKEEEDDDVSVSLSVSVSVATTNDDTAEEDQSKYIPRWLRKLKMKTWWSSLMQILKFIFHFGGTMLILYLGALVFAEIEDHVNEDHLNELHNKLNSNISYNKKKRFTAADLKDGNQYIFLAYIKQVYNITIEEKQQQQQFFEELKVYVAANNDLNAKIANEKQIQDRSFTIIKWFYFMIIASTTIGFGDVVPVTESGKLFYIAFSVVTIPLMMTLLKTTSEMITIVNKKFFVIVNQLLCKKKKRVSEELLSAISVVSLFIGYISIGCVFTAATDKYTLLDGVYFWVNAFTTVGFGDIVPSMKTQVDYFVFNIFYIIFGLTMLASVIDSWSLYLQFRKDAIIQENKMKLINSVRNKSMRKLRRSAKMNQANLDGLSHDKVDKQSDSLKLHEMNIPKEMASINHRDHPKVERRRTVTFNEPNLKEDSKS